MKEITIPEGYEARIADNKIVFVKKESEEEHARKWLITLLQNNYKGNYWATQAIAYLEKQKAKEQYDRLAPIYADQESFEAALDKAWKFYNDSGSSTVDGCEDNAFELAFAKGFREGFLCKENQTEQKVDIDKLRKDIYQSGYDDGYQHGKEDVQKEQKSAQTKDEAEYVRTLESLISNFLRGKQEVDEEYYQRICNWLEGRHVEKEQKPVRLNDDTEVGLSRALQIVEAAKGNLRGYQSDDGIYECYHAIQTLKRILSNGIGCKSVKWSEEDEEKVNRLSDLVVSQSSFSSEWKKELLTWLKALCPQSQRKDTYYDIIHSILAMLKDLDFMQITPQHRVSLLNDIRVRCKDADECATILDESCWKPSEQQVTDLRNLLDKLGNLDKNNIKMLKVYHWSMNYENLKNLLNDLNKLI